MHRKKTCVKNAAFYQNDVICRKCGRVIGFRYEVGGENRIFLFSDFKRYLLKPYNEIPELAAQTSELKLSFDDIHSEILEEIKGGLNISEPAIDAEDEDEMIEKNEEDFNEAEENE